MHSSTKRHKLGPWELDPRMLKQSVRLCMVGMLGASTPRLPRSHKSHKSDFELIKKAALFFGGPVENDRSGPWLLER